MGKAEVKLDEELNVLMETIKSYMQNLRLAQEFCIFCCISSIALLTILCLIYKVKKGYKFYYIISSITAILIICFSIVFIVILNDSEKISIIYNNSELFVKNLPKNILWICLIFLILEFILLVIYGCKEHSLFSSDNRPIFYYAMGIKLIFIVIKIAVISISYRSPIVHMLNARVLYSLLMVINIILKTSFTIYFLDVCYCIKEDNIRNIKNVGKGYILEKIDKNNTNKKIYKTKSFNKMSSIEEVDENSENVGESYILDKNNRNKKIYKTKCINTMSSIEEIDENSQNDNGHKDENNYNDHKDENNENDNSQNIQMYCGTEV